MAFPLDARQVTAVPLTSFLAVKWKDTITPPLDNGTDCNEIETDGLTKKMRLYPAKSVAQPNVTVSLR